MPKVFFKPIVVLIVLLVNIEMAFAKAPDSFRVSIETTKGSFEAEFTRKWAPKGVDRLHKLVKDGFFKDIAVFRVLPGFVAQFGIHGDPKVSSKWRKMNIKDDPFVGNSNKRGTITFATAGPNTRTTQFFINYGDNARLDQIKSGSRVVQSFVPIGQVLGTGMKVVDKFYSGYGEGAPRGRGPAQDKLQSTGNAYLKKNYPKLDYIKSIKLLPKK